ncbi:M20/M25/M40 family metallo-hydrolase [Bdellovibrio sp. HCB337]|uniref:M20/M25/M40 family metallo-hydrolase n=1 Tax=Bdellovibrio sp. HCB337 TaxID=3394358 RepID=UPI0039A68A6E
MMKQYLVTGMVLLVSSAAFAARPILAETSFLRALNIPIIAEEPETKVAYAEINDKMEETILHHAHLYGKCGGFEALPEKAELQLQSVQTLFSSLREQKQKNDFYERAPLKIMQVVKNPQIEAALQQVSEKNLESTVTWLSSFPTRASRDSKANEPVNAFKDRLAQMTVFTGFPVQVELINHSGTKQKSIHLTIPGKTRPQESIVLGAHFDSITQKWGETHAPGADDNASGSANLLETLRILLAQPQPERTIEFFWYAGEESGLIGSGEIAAQYKSQNKDVIAVLQLDMTLYPGEGLFTLGSMTDFTSAWLREYLHAINNTYLKINILEGQCGYGCSDHASWHKNSYPALMPFEARLRTMNPNIHSSRDVISSDLNFSHSAMFTKIAVIMAMDLGNSVARQPY